MMNADGDLMNTVYTIHEKNKNTMRRALKKTKRNFNDYGFFTTLIKILVSITHPVLYRRSYLLYRANLDTVLVPEILDPSFKFRMLERGEEDYKQQITNMAEWFENSIENHMISGAQCLLALDGDTVAGFNLVTFDRINLPVVNYSRKLRSKQAFSDQIMVHKAYRGRGLGASLRWGIFRFLREHGIRYFYGGTEANNQANLALCRKVGLKVIAEIRYLKLMWLRSVTVRRVSQ